MQVPLPVSANKTLFSTRDLFAAIIGFTSVECRRRADFSGTCETDCTAVDFRRRIIFCGCIVDRVGFTSVEGLRMADRVTILCFFFRSRQLYRQAISWSA